MCFDLDSHPPIRPIAGAAVDGERITLQSADGTDFACYAAQPARSTGAAILILPDVRGLFTFYEELVLRFAEAGVAALAVDYFGRTFGTTERPQGFDHSPHIAQVTWDGLRADIEAARHEVAHWPGVRGVFSVGFCFGGRLSLDLATEPELEMAGVIGFYGWPTGAHRSGSPTPVDVADRIECPILALFGGADEGLGPDVRAAFERALSDAGIEHEVVTYEGAPHSFFDRKAAEFQDASDAAWAKTLAFIQAHTAA
jgi:carboxymethylenebutenolidase